MSRPVVIGYRVSGTRWNWEPSKHGATMRSGSGGGESDFEAYREASKWVRRLIASGWSASVETVVVPMELRL